MKADAREAAKAILANRRAVNSDCWKKAKTACKCASGMGWLFMLVALTEVFTNTMIILFDVVSDRTIVYMVLVIAVPPRIAVFIWASWRLSKRNWWRYWITIDNILMLTVVISIVYGYMLLKVPVSAGATSGDLEWRIAAVVCLPLLMSAFNGNFRILIKMYPWTPLTITIYKGLRIYAVVLGTISQLSLRGKNVPGMDPGLLILYVSSLASYHVSLLARIPSWTAWQRSMEAKLKAAQAAGVQLTLDDVANPLALKATASLAAGYTSFDDENEEATQYFNISSTNNPAISLQLGSNDDATIPVDISSIQALHQYQSPLSSTDDDEDALGYL